MKIYKYKYWAPVSNVGDTIFKIDLPGKRKFVKKRFSSIVEKLCLHTGLPVYEIETELESSYCTDKQKKYVYLIEGDFEIPDVDEMRKKDILYDTRIMEKYEQETEDLIKILRLCSGGYIDIIGHFVFLKDGKNLEPDSSFQDRHFQDEDFYYVTDSVAQKANELLRSLKFPLNPPYVNLAFDNFHISYNQDSRHLAFLSLMIGLEVLFNVGKNELRYRVSRNCSILLAKNRNEFKQYFKELTQLYDKRSKLVHTGKIDDFTYYDLKSCRNILRKSILKVIELNISKNELAEKLNLLGFRTNVL